MYVQYISWKLNKYMYFVTDVQETSETNFGSYLIHLK